jgi:hypothetical protein
VKLVSGAQARQRAGWIGAADQHQLHLGRHVLDEENHRFLNGSGADRLVIVQDQGDWIRKCGNLADQVRQD